MNMIDHGVGEVADNVLVVDDGVKVDDKIVAVNGGAEYIFYPSS